MASKIVVFALALLIQTISAQVIGGIYGPGVIGPNLAVETAALAGAYGPGLPAYPAALPYPANALAFEAASPILGCGFGLTLSELTANGGGFAVTSTSPLNPNGVRVQSDSLLFEGPLAVTGTLPFLGSVGLEGPLPAVGQGAVAYGCGNGNVGILTEETSGFGPAAMYPGPMGPNPAMAGYNGMGLRGPCGPMY